MLSRTTASTTITVNVTGTDDLSPVVLWLAETVAPNASAALNSSGAVAAMSSVWNTVPTNTSVLRLANGGVTFVNLSESVHVWTVQAVDGAGNAQPLPFAQIVTTVDVTPPVLSFAHLSARTAGFVTSPAFNVCVAATDQTETVMNVTLVKPDGSTANAVSSTDDANDASIIDSDCLLVPLSSDGNYSLVVTGVDDGGNVGAPISTWFVLDTVPPTSTFVSTPGALVATGSLTVVLTGSDPQPYAASLMVLYGRVDGGAWQPAQDGELVSDCRDHGDRAAAS